MGEKRFILEATNMNELLNKNLSLYFSSAFIACYVVFRAIKCDSSEF